MPASPHTTLLCRYHYDPLDRQAGSAPVEQAVIQRFYCKSRLTTEIQDTVQRSIVQHEDQLLAQRHCEGPKVDTTLLTTDQQRSVLHALDATSLHAFAYTPYGHRPLNGLLSLLGFNGERPDPVTGHYHLGNGYRQFNSVLMRFNSPDSWSPFGEGGLNAYAYCAGDPVNRMDQTGHSFYTALKAVLKFRRPLSKMRRSLMDGTSSNAGRSSALDLPATSSVNSLTQHTPPTAPMSNASAELTASSPTTTASLSLKSQHRANRLMARQGGRRDTYHQENVAMQAAVDQPPNFHAAQNSSPPSYYDAIQQMNPSDPNYPQATLNAVARKLELEPGRIRD